MPSGNYVAAGGDTFVALMRRFMVDCPDLVTSDNVVNVLDNTINKSI